MALEQGQNTNLDNTEAPSQTTPTQMTPALTPPSITPAPVQPLIPETSNKGFKKKLAAIIAGAIIVLAGGSAAAYYGFVVPNKPENILKSAVVNKLKKDEISGKGNASFKASTGPAVTVAYTAQGNNAQNALAGTLDVSVTGVKIPLEYKIFEKSAYLKVGDLSTVQSLLSAFVTPTEAKGIKKLADKISNKWIEFDESLIKSAVSDKCNLAQEVSDEDIDKMVKIYENNRFANVKGTSSEVVEGKKVTKIDLGFDKEKVKAFAKEAESLDVIKNLKECSTPSNNSQQTNTEEFSGNAEMSVWVDKGKKEIVKISAKITDTEGTLEADFVYNNDKVDIQKPADAIPALQLLGELKPLLNDFGGGSNLPSNSTTPNYNSLGL